MNDNVTPDDVKSNVRVLHVAASRHPGAPPKDAPSTVLQTNQWSTEVRIRNLTEAISRKFSGDVFLTTEQVTELFKISPRTLRRIPQKKLMRFALDGSTGHRYATVDIAAYFVLYASELDCAMAI